jgi:divalent metal cation (Fe/Co/Zn/Cd) transporter
MMSVEEDARERWVRRALWLVAGTMVYNLVEAVVALWAGREAGSIALLGFGLDSVIELVAATVVLWRMSVELRGAETEAVRRAELRVRRAVGVTFFALAVYVVVQSVWTLWSEQVPSESLVGLALAIASLVIMPLIAVGKLRAATVLRSGALRAEAKETLACSYLSFCLLGGLAANAALGWWWADPTAALLMVPWLIHEGREAFEEEEEDEEEHEERLRAPQGAQSV